MAEKSGTSSDYDDIDDGEEYDDNEEVSNGGESDNNEEEKDMGEDGDTDEDEEMDEEQELMKQYIEILGRIDQNKYYYDNYVQLVDIAHKLSDLDKIRQSCELFSSIYPLAPDIWLRWLKIEQNLACTPEEIFSAEKLFRRALSDYFSIDVALEFANLALKSPNSDSTWDELLAVYGLHCTKGRQLYILWRNYIETKDIAVEEKKQKLVKVFKDELSLPLCDMEESYIEFKIYCEKNQDISVNWEVLDKRYNRAKDDLKRILPFEKRLAELDSKNHTERASIYIDYILEADKFVDDNILQILYERMVTDCCLNPTCWLNYINYLDRNEKYIRDEKLDKYIVFQQTPIDIVNRSLRNCPWSEKLYIKKMYLCEKQGRSKQDIREILESGLEAGFQQPEPAVALWLEYLSYLRRHTNFEDEKEVEILRKNFDFAWSTLGVQWGVLADCDCEILQFWGKLEYGAMNNPLKGKDLWTTVMESSDNASKSGLWIEFAHLELKRDVEGTRRIFRKALSINTLDNPSIIISAWLRFERCNGTLFNIINCQELCEKTMNQFENKSNRNNKFKTESRNKGIKRKIEEKLQVDGNTDVNLSSKDTSHSAQNSDQVEKDGDTQNVFKKPKLNENKPHKVIKEHENEEIDTTKDHLRIFLSNLDYNITENEIISGLSEIQIADVNLIKASNGRGRGFAYVELLSEEEVNKALALDRKIIKGRPLYISSVLRDKEKRQKFKYSESIEPKKLFIKGIPYDATKEELETLFSPFGKIKDIRIVYHKSGKPKGIAYIEYEDECAASAAVLKMDQYKLRDFKFNVAISAPPPKSIIKEELNLNKLLGIGRTRKQEIRGARPKMNLIPTVVKKNALYSCSSLSSNTSEQTSNYSPQKSNDDFRKYINK